jgi:hypothetical protein
MCPVTLAVIQVTNDAQVWSLERDLVIKDVLAVASRIVGNYTAGGCITTVDVNLSPVTGTAGPIGSTFGWVKLLV